MKNNLGTIGTYKWFLAQVATGQNETVKESTWNDTHGDRVKIRIPGKHPRCASQGLPDDNLPWAIVAKPTSHGNKNKVHSGIWGGEWVIGFFMDEGEQQPVITHVLGNNQTEYDANDTDCLKRVNRYNSGMKPGEHQITTGDKPSKQTDINSDDFKDVEVKKQNSTYEVNGITYDTASGRPINSETGNNLLDESQD